jgi:hypothetical protein
MIYQTNFEIFAVSVKNRYQRVTGGDFFEDFGEECLLTLRRQYESNTTPDEAVSSFMERAPRLLNRCACECGVVS